MRVNPLSFFLLLTLLGFVGCGSPSPEDYRDEGQRRVLLLTNTLRTIKSRDQLLTSQDILRRQFDELVDLIIRAREASLKYPLATDDHLNIDLQAQLQRLSRITGGLEILEKCQEVALNRLDRFEKSQEGLSL